MSVHRRAEDVDPVRGERIGRLEERRVTRSLLVGSGTLACPRCDAPVVLPAPALAPADLLLCPYCDHGGALRDFLSFATPSRPTRVDVRIVQRPR